MLSKLDSIFKTQFRHAENTDTRQAIQRRDQDHKRRKDEDETNNGGPEIWHDDISVSVQSVKNILEQLLHKPAIDFEQSAKQTGAPAPESEEKGPDNKQPPASQQAAKAAMAYQRTWETAHPEDQIYKPTKENLPEISLSGNEARMINDLIEALGTLLKNNIHHLTLEKSDSFLQALQNAVDKAMAELNQPS